MRLFWPGVCWQPMLLAHLDAVSWGALVSDPGGSSVTLFALPASSVSHSTSRKVVVVSL